MPACPALPEPRARAGARLRVAFLFVLAALPSAACEDRKTSVIHDAGPTEPSPNASILPAPLASNVEAPCAGKLSPDELERRDAGHALLDAGTDAAPPEPHSLREDQ